METPGNTVAAKEERVKSVMKSWADDDSSSDGSDIERNPIKKNAGLELLFLYNKYLFASYYFK